MQTILNDIELDVAELRCLLLALSTDNDPKLTAVANRNIGRLKQKLDELQQRLNQQPTAASDTNTPSPAHAEEVVSACVRGEEDTSSVKADEPAAPPSPVAPKAGDSILAERIRPAQDLRHALSLNDTFRFSRELFEGDAARLNQLLQQLGGVSSWEEARRLLAQEVHVPEDHPARIELEELLKKYFD